MEPKEPQPASLAVRVDDRLVFEREPVAQWVGSGAELRILALLILLVRRKMHDPIRVRLPWGMIGISVGAFVMMAAIVGAVAWLLSLVEWNSLAP